MKRIDYETFDFGDEFAKGLTPEQAKAESIRRIREWWGNGNYKEQKGIDYETFNFDVEFAKGLAPEEFKEEMSKRIKAYPWKNKY